MTSTALTKNARHRHAPHELPQASPTAVASRHRCRFCDAPLAHTFVDLGMSPLCESYLDARTDRRDGAVLSAARLRVRACFLVQLPRVRSSAADIFSEYAYFSSYSDSWLLHAADTSSR